MSSKIEWTEETWNPIAGCSPVSRGCDFCYAAREALRLAGNPHPAIRAKYEGTATMRGANSRRRPVFTGRITVADYRTMGAPLRWRKPRLVFVNSMSDLFHPDVMRSTVREVFGVMADAPRHTFQVLTKRPERMPGLLEWIAPDHVARDGSGWPLPNVWLGVSVEDQAAADERIPLLLETPAVVRFLSCEPLLGPVNLDGLWGYPGSAICEQLDAWPLHWVIAGGESGPNARPMHPDWPRSIRDQCQAAGVPFFFKQWGEWSPVPKLPSGYGCLVEPGDGVVTEKGETASFEADGSCRLEGQGTAMRRTGKKTAGRELDGREWNEMPEVAA